MIVRWPLGTTDDVLGRSREEDVVQWLVMVNKEVMLAGQCQAPPVALGLLVIGFALRLGSYWFLGSSESAVRKNKK